MKFLSLSLLVLAVSANQNVTAPANATAATNSTVDCTDTNLPCNSVKNADLNYTYIFFSVVFVAVIPDLTFNTDSKVPLNSPYYLE